jgi:site-specific recombinase XerD
MTGSGLRREEIVKLSWGDVNMQTGHVKVKEDKGGKDRSVALVRRRGGRYRACRTFTILLLHAKMRLLHLQQLGGWESLDTVDPYAQMVDEDLLQEHRTHSPVDNL